MGLISTPFGSYLKACRGAGFVIAVSICACISGCATPPDAPDIRSVAIVPGGTAVTRPYHLTPGDDITIRFLYAADLNDDVAVGPDGTVNLQIVHNVRVAGLTVEEARDRLNQEFSKIIKEPTITVAVKTYSLQQIYVMGQVNNPGLVRDTVPLTLSRAITQAGGIKIYSARRSDVLLVRRAPDGSIVYYKIDMSNGVTGPGIDPLLTSYDVIYVPETYISSVADFIASNLLRIIPFSASLQPTL